VTRLYQIRVSARGEMVAEERVEALDALTAINRVETDYGDPAQVQYKTIYHDNGHKEVVLVVSHWHGYTFVARRLT